MATKRLSLLLPLMLVAALWLPAASAAVPTAQEPDAGPPVSACAKGAFSTEEDFIARDVKPFDGNLYISDGDMLSFDGQVCMRNANLTAAWFADAPWPRPGAGCAGHPGSRQTDHRLLHRGR